MTVGIVSALFIWLTITVTSCKVAGQTQKQEKGFVQIFDGKTLNGWEGDPTYWRVENGNLVGEITPTTVLKTNNFIIWRGGMPGDFELTCDFKITKAGNSGINYRSVEVPDVPHALRGYQADIDGANRYTGQNYEERARTTLAYRGEKATINPPTGSAATLRDFVKNNAWTERTVTGSLGTSDELQTKIKSEDWNTCRIVAKGNHLQHYINGILMSDVTDNDTVNGKANGLIGVQVHVGPPMKVQYRNIMLKQ
ncbi:MAG: DUF1080 domain-containing protein [Bacteroidota bacterium]|nr:DUF1080 domain-containing protein [Bacteroidota bacterium]